MEKKKNIYKPKAMNFCRFQIVVFGGVIFLFEIEPTKQGETRARKKNTTKKKNDAVNCDYEGFKSCFWLFILILE